MKNYIVYFILLLTLVLTGACNNEWVEEVYVQNVGLKAPVNSKGVTDVYLRYRANGEVTYRLPVIVGGSTMNERDLDVVIDVDPDTLIGLNEARWKQREDLYFQFVGIRNTMSLPLLLVIFRLVNVKVCLILNSNLTDWILLINGYFH